MRKLLIGIVTTLTITSILLFQNINAASINYENPDRCLEESSYIYDEPSEEENNNNDEEYEEETGGYIWGCKWEDSDADGIWDSNENPLEDWEIELVNADTGDIIDSTYTDKDGYYDFSNLDGGNYILREVQQDDWTQTAPDDMVCEITIGDVIIYTGDWNLNDYACVFGNTLTNLQEPTVTPSPIPDKDNNNSQKRGGSGSQSRNDDTTVTPTDDSDVLGTTTQAPSATQEILAKTGFSLTGIAALGLLNLQLILLSSTKGRSILLKLISKVA